MIHPVITHLYPELDLRQLEVVGHRDGALRVIAGPGAGKTLVMCLLGVNLLLLGEVQPEQLVLCTFGKPAAAKLRQRFRRAATAAGYGGDLDRVRIATIHSICRRILGPAHTLLDGWQRLDLLSTHFHRIFGPDQAALGRWLRRDGDWDLDQAAKHFDRIVEELIRPQDLIDSGIPFLAAVGRCYRRYEATLRDEDLVDFAHLQAWVYDLLLDDRIADPIAAGIRYLLVDEYQDTTHIQERILLRLARAHGNLCVVGDDDQGIYRFRGASVRNLLEFPEHFSRLPHRGTDHQLPQQPGYRRHGQRVHVRGRLDQPRRRPALPVSQNHQGPRARRSRRLSGGDRGGGAGPGGRVSPAGGVGPIPEAPGRDHRLQPGGAAAAQRGRVDQ